MVFRRRRERAQPASPEIEANRQTIAAGWNGLGWGTTVAEFQACFPEGSRTDSGWWLTGANDPPLFGFTMLTQYSFNARDQLCVVAFYPDMADREHLTVAVINGLGMPVGDDIRWTIGDVTVDVKAAGVAASLTHRALAAAGR